MLNRPDLLHCLAGHQELPCIPSTASCLSVSRLDRIHRRSFDYAYKPWIPLLSLSLNRQDRPCRPPSRGWQVQSRGGSLHLVRVQVYIEKSAKDVGPLLETLSDGARPLSRFTTLQMKEPWQIATGYQLFMRKFRQFARHASCWSCGRYFKCDVYMARRCLGVLCGH